MMRFSLRQLLRAYGDLVNKQPFVAQVGTAGVLVTVADVIAQNVIERKKKYDYRRTAVMSTCGFLYIGPIVAIWLSALNRWGLNAITNVALDQFLVAPFLLSGFLVVQSLLLGKGWRAAKHRLRHELPGILKVNYMVWIPVQLINFQVVPFQYRMLFGQVIALFWNCYLSNKMNQQKEIGESNTLLTSIPVKENL